MKNSTSNFVFEQDAIDALMASFEEDAARLARLSSPLSNVSFTIDEDNEN